MSSLKKKERKEREQVKRQLVVAAREGNCEEVRVCCEKLKKNPQNLNYQDQEKGNTAMMAAALNGHKDVVHMLKEFGADVHVQNNDGNTAIMLATFRGHKDVVQMLKEFGADIHVKNKHGNTALILAAQEDHKDVLHMLKEVGADVHAQDNHGNTAMMTAAIKGHQDVVHMLKEFGADVHVQNKLGNSAMLFAALNGHREVVLILKEFGVDVHAKNKDGCTAMMLAAARGHKDVVHMLKEFGADVDVQNKNGHTAMTLAAQYGHKDVVQMLKEFGADVHVQDKRGNGLLEMSGNEEVKDLVRQYLAGGEEQPRKQRGIEEGKVDAHDNFLKSVEDVKLEEVKGDTVVLNFGNTSSSDLSAKEEMNSTQGVEALKAEIAQFHFRLAEQERKAKQDTETLVAENAQLRIQFEEQKTKQDAEIRAAEIAQLRIDLEEKRRLNETMKVRQDAEIRAAETAQFRMETEIARLQMMLEKEESKNKAHNIEWCHLHLDHNDDDAILDNGSTGKVVLRATYMLKGKNACRIPVTVAVKLITVNLLQGGELYDTVREKTWSKFEIMHRISKGVYSDVIVRPFGVVDGPLPEEWRTVSKILTNESVVGIVMQYESGGSLDSLLRGKCKREIQMLEKICILRGIAKCLSALHGLPEGYPVAHGDIKPANVMLGDQIPTSVKLTNFGLSEYNEELWPTGEMSMTQLMQGPLCGTPLYAAPELLGTEQSRLRQKPSRSSDMYSFGILSWEVLTGTIPYSNMSNIYDFDSLSNEVQSGRRPDLTELPQNTPREVVRMIELCFDENGEKRMMADQCSVLLDAECLSLSEDHNDIFNSYPWYMVCKGLWAKE